MANDKLLSRQSGMELLRIIAMLLVVIVHTDYYTFGAPTYDYMQSNPDKAFAMYLVDSIAIICVNCFVFISGWFGIRPKRKSFANLLFQIVFFNLLLYFGYVALGKQPFSLMSFVSHCNFLEHWFIPTYIALFFIAPMLNIFVEKADKTTLRNVIVALAVLELILGWTVDYLHIKGGYSLLSFILIYLVARTLKARPVAFIERLSKWQLMGIYALCVGVNMAIVYTCYFFYPAGISHIGRFFNYASPIVLVASFAFCLFFTKLRFKSVAINWIAASAFAIYLFHTDRLFLDRFFVNFCRSQLEANNIYVFSLIMVGFVLAVAAVSILLDQLRILVWRLIAPIFDSKKGEQ